MIFEWLDFALAGAGTYLQMLWNWNIVGDIYFGPFIVATFVIGVVFRAVLYKA